MVKKISHRGHVRKEGVSQIAYAGYSTRSGAILTLGMRGWQRPRESSPHGHAWKNLKVRVIDQLP